MLVIMARLTQASPSLSCAVVRNLPSFFPVVFGLISFHLAVFLRVAHCSSLVKAKVEFKSNVSKGEEEVVGQASTPCGAH